MTEKKKTRVIAYQSDYGACYGYRLYFPLENLKRKHPDEFAVAITPAMHGKDVASADAIILARQYDGVSFKVALDGRRLAGTKIIYEADDDLLNLPEWNPFAHYFSHPDIHENLILFLQECDAIFVSTEHLKKTYLQYNNHVYVLPNSMWLHLHMERPHNNKRPVIGWTGSGTHAGDLARAQPALETIRESKEAMIKLFWFPEFKDVYQIPFVHWTTYYTALALCDFDVSLAPLTDHSFNASKSNIKWMEAALAGSPTIASNVGPYKETIKNEETGILIDDDSDWLPQIRRVLADEGLANRLVANAKEDIKARFNIEINYLLWKAAIEEVVARPVKNTGRHFLLSKGEVVLKRGHPSGWFQDKR